MPRESVGTRLRPAVVTELRAAAEADGITVSNFIARCVQRELLQRRMPGHDLAK